MKIFSDKNFKLEFVLYLADVIIFNVACLSRYGFGLLYVPDYGDNGIPDFFILNTAYITALCFVGISLHRRMSLPANIIRNTTRTTLLFIILYSSLCGILRFNVPDALECFLFASAIFALTTVERLFIRWRIKMLRFKGRNMVGVLIIGTGGMMQKTVDVMSDAYKGYNILGYFGDEKEPLHYGNGDGRLERLGTYNEIIGYLKKHNVKNVYMSLEYSRTYNPQEIIRFCMQNMIRLYFVPDTLDKSRHAAKIKEFGDIYVLSEYNEPLLNIKNRMKKRVFDVTVSALFLCTLFPLIFVIVTIISKITMPGPLFFKQKRTGYDGRDFECLKFRSMKINVDSDKVQAVKNDSRVTKWGAFMRHSNIDELPQFVNVLKGEMSIVGPRPHMLAHTEYYSNLISDYMIRHYVKPGITGWAQTNGERGETKTVEDMQRRVKRDIWYIEHWSIWLDIWIILKTVYDAVHGDKKAY